MIVKILADSRFQFQFVKKSSMIFFLKYSDRVVRGFFNHFDPLKFKFQNHSIDDPNPSV